MHQTKWEMVLKILFFYLKKKTFKKSNFLPWIAPDETPLWGENGYVENQKEPLNFRPDTSWTDPKVTWASPKYNNTYPTLPKSLEEKRNTAQNTERRKGFINKTKKKSK
jgi:hypothetical protein